MNLLMLTLYELALTIDLLLIVALASEMDRYLPVQPKDAAE